MDTWTFNFNGVQIEVGPGVTIRVYDGIVQVTADRLRDVPRPVEIVDEPEERVAQTRKAAKPKQPYTMSPAALAARRKGNIASLNKRKTHSPERLEQLRLQAAHARSYREKARIDGTHSTDNERYARNMSARKLHEIKSKAAISLDDIHSRIIDIVSEHNKPISQVTISKRLPPLGLAMQEHTRFILRVLLELCEQGILKRERGHDSHYWFYSPAEVEDREQGDNRSVA